jgi:cation diffusion facilitator CzcD-associated flavoprotein CzcO
MQAKTVVIVGAGLSGLQVARALLKRGQHPLVIEQGEAVGGVWTNKAYAGLGVHGECCCLAPWAAAERELVSVKKFEHSAMLACRVLTLFIHIGVNLIKG